jgi:hypothetical protein
VASVLESGRGEEEEGRREMVVEDNHQQQHMSLMGYPANPECAECAVIVFERQRSSSTAVRYNN